MSARPVWTTRRQPVRRASDASDDEDDEYFDVDDVLWLSPQQTATLRKETATRRRNKRLATHFVPHPSGDAAEEDGVVGEEGEEGEADLDALPWWLDEETLAAVHASLVGEELVEVRALSPGDIRGVKNAADDLALELMLFRGDEGVEEEDDDDDDDDDDDEVTPVKVIQRKGHAAVLYRPRPEIEEGGGEGGGGGGGGARRHRTIVLRTSRRTVWTPKEKPERDGRGQIVK